MEIKRLLKRKKMWLVMIGLLVVQIAFFGFLIHKEGDSFAVSKFKRDILEEYPMDQIEELRQRIEKEKKEQKEIAGQAYEELGKQVDYIQNYPFYVKSVLEQSNVMGTVSIFQQTDSFSNKNLAQTKKDYSCLQKVKPCLFYDDYIKKFIDFKPLHGFALLSGVIVVLALVEENKKGLRCILFSTVNGRGRLVASKVFALFITAGMIVAVFYGAGYLESLVVYQGHFFRDLTYPLQSVSYFGDFTHTITVGQFLLLYMVYHWMVLFLIMMLAWGIFFCMEHTILAFGTIALLGIVSYLLYYGIGANSPIQILRYCNLWYLFAQKDVFCEYKNLNVHASLLSKEFVITGTFVGMFLALLLFTYLSGTRKYPCASNKGIISRKIIFLQKRIRTFWGRRMEKCSVLGLELYKVIFCQKGWIVLLAFILIFWQQTDFTSVQRTVQQDMYNTFMEQYEGIPDQRAEDYIAGVEEKVAKVQRAYEQVQEKYERGETDSYELIQAGEKLQAYEPDRLFIEKVQKQTEYLENLKQDKGIAGWYVNEDSFSHLLDNGSVQMVGNLIYVLGIVFLCSGVFSFENKCGTRHIILGTKEGRTTLVRQKWMVAEGIMAVSFGFRTALELWNIKAVYGISGLNAPVQSVSVLSFVGFPCSIGVFLILLYVAKFLVMAAVVCMVCMFSVRWSQKATIALSVTACIPTVLYLVGVSVCKYLSVIHLLNINQVLLETQNANLLILLTLLFGIMGIVAIRRTYSGWLSRNGRLEG